MTLIEAIKSGKRFKRKNDKVWLEYKDEKIKYDDGIMGVDDLGHTAKSILATDWEVEPEIYEFECEWLVQDNMITAVGPGCGIASFPVPLNKKCRIRVEVIDDSL